MPMYSLFVEQSVVISLQLCNMVRWRSVTMQAGVLIQDLAPCQTIIAGIMPLQPWPWLLCSEGQLLRTVALPLCIKALVLSVPHVYV